ncbi:MAG TPA: DHHA1 domain-containing protein, partial [Candidatus Sulfotelmatobacter sp.]|nr:DHHA1 domain-containing protein [Candidatus Sulfotelmatobacter sp.]
RGSARSIAGLNIFAVLTGCQDLFLDFGGHEGAAGFEIEPARIPELERRLQESVDRTVNLDELVPLLSIDAEVGPEQLTLSLVKELEKLAPFGEGNPDPVLLIRDLPLLDLKTVGGQGRHLKAWFGNNGARVEAIGFGLGGRADKLVNQRRYDLAVNLASNEYNGFETAQLSLVDIRESRFQETGE